MTWIDRCDYDTPPPENTTCRVDMDDSPCSKPECPYNCPVLVRIRQATSSHTKTKVEQTKPVITTE